MARRSRSIRFALVALTLLPAVVAFRWWGGWGVVTVDDLPEAVAAGETVTIGFAVRQHGVQLMGGLNPTVILRSGTAETRVAATARGTGRYSATFKAPQSGSLALTINTGFNETRLTLAPIAVIAAGRPVPTMAAEDRGRTLFVAKGCVTCHVHGATAEYESGRVGPELTGRRFEQAYLARFLANPSIKPPSTRSGPMPNLELKPLEVGPLVAFINGDSRVSSR